MSAPSDKRNHARIAVVVDVDIASGSNFFTGKTRDLSLGGVFIETDLQLDVGAPLTLELSFDGQRFRVSSEVMWTFVGKDRRVVGAGVRFSSIAPPVQKAIEAFMKTREPMRFDMEADAEELKDDD